MGDISHTRRATGMTSVPRRIAGTVVLVVVSLMIPGPAKRATGSKSRATLAVTAPRNSEGGQTCGRSSRLPVSS